MECVFRLEGEYWTVLYASCVRRFRNRRGFELLAELLRQPGQKVAAARLEAISGKRENALPEDAERARINVTRAIKDTLARIRIHHPSLSAHLDASVRTGVYCVYWPDPQLRIVWETESRDTAEAA